MHLIDSGKHLVWNSVVFVAEEQHGCLPGGDQLWEQGCSIGEFDRHDSIAVPLLLVDPMFFGRCDTVNTRSRAAKSVPLDEGIW